jgi:hypothetical protein
MPAIVFARKDAKDSKERREKFSLDFAPLREIFFTF